MEMTGEQLIPLPQQTVWEGLNDPAVLKDCITGCNALAAYPIANSALPSPWQSAR